MKRPAPERRLSRRAARTVLFAALGLFLPLTAPGEIEVRAAERAAAFDALRIAERPIRRFLSPAEKLVLWLPDGFGPSPSAAAGEVAFADAGSDLVVRVGRREFKPGASLLHTAELALESLRQGVEPLEVASVRRLRVASRPAIEATGRSGDAAGPRSTRLLWIAAPDGLAYHFFRLDGASEPAVDDLLARTIRDFCPIDVGLWSSAFERVRRGLVPAEASVDFDRRQRAFAEIARPDSIGAPAGPDRLRELARGVGSALLVDGALHTHPRVRVAALEAIEPGALPASERVRFLAWVLRDADAAVRYRAARRIAEHSPALPDLADEVLVHVFDTDDTAARAAAFQLVAAHPPSERARLLAAAASRIGELPAKSQMLVVHLLERWAAPEAAEAALSFAARASRDPEVREVSLRRLLERGQGDWLRAARERLLHPSDAGSPTLALSAYGLAIHSRRSGLEGLRRTLDSVAAAEGKTEEERQDGARARQLLTDAIAHLSELPTDEPGDECAPLERLRRKAKESAAAEDSVAAPGDWASARRAALGCTPPPSAEIAWLHMSQPGGILSEVLSSLERLQVGTGPIHDVYHTALGQLSEKLGEWAGDPFSIASTGIDLSGPIDIAWWNDPAPAETTAVEVGGRVRLRATEFDRSAETLLRLSSRTAPPATLSGGLLALQALPLVPASLFAAWDDERAAQRGEGEDDDPSSNEKPERLVALAAGPPNDAPATTSLEELALGAGGAASWSSARLDLRDGTLEVEFGRPPAAPEPGGGAPLAAEVEPGADRPSSRFDLDLTAVLEEAARQSASASADREEEVVPPGLRLRVTSYPEPERLTTTFEVDRVPESWLQVLPSASTPERRAAFELLPETSLLWLDLEVAPGPLRNLLDEQSVRLTKWMGAEEAKKLTAAAEIFRGEVGFALVGAPPLDSEDATDAWRRRLIGYAAVDPTLAAAFLDRHLPRGVTHGRLRLHALGSGFVARIGGFLVFGSDRSTLAELGKAPFLAESVAYRELLERTPAGAALVAGFDSDRLADAVVEGLRSREDASTDVLGVEVVRALGRVAASVRRVDHRLVGELSLAPRLQPEEAVRRSRELAAVAPYTASSVLTTGFPPDLGDDDPLAELEVTLRLAPALSEPDILWSHERLEQQRLQPRVYRLRSRSAPPLPESSPIRAPISSAALLPYLRSEPEFDFETGAVRETALQIRGKEEDPARIVRAIVAWTHARLRYSVIRRSPRVDEILTTRKADCTEFTQLTIALARSLGIPARPVGGIHLGPGGAILHRWAEVYIDQWYEVDSTFGEVEISAASLRLPTMAGSYLASAPGSSFRFEKALTRSGSEVTPTTATDPGAAP